MNAQESIYAIALTRLRGLSLLNARKLYEAMGSAGEVYVHRKEILDCIPDASERLVEALNGMDDAVRLAEQEMVFVEQKGVQVLTLNDPDYPKRLKECEDAPLVLYYYGTAHLNASHIVSVIGTRRCSEYGRGICNNFIASLKQCCPDVLVVSGLAYGIDICAHRAALANKMTTIGVLAHGLDTIYPSMHRQTAIEMVREGGGLLTEYMTHTTPEKMNFVSRNRIVAGLCDACVVVESPAKGGSLITADLANDYNRDVFAFPGRVYDESCAGCLRLIQQNGAKLLMSGEDLVDAMGWPNALRDKPQQKATQQELFPVLTEEERTLVNVLRNVDNKHINQIAIDANIPCARASMILLDLEIKGIVKELGGARYRIVR
ncbi:MAG: DNA-processing protein DprA [Bacteroidaceae bacterium]|nr:DNA-processing protein DprA [Bacteroidaceae bacterium]